MTWRKLAEGASPFGRTVVADADGNTVVAALGSPLGITIVQELRNDPPASPVSNVPYFVGYSPTGAWAGHAQQFATWDGSSWSFTVGDYFSFKWDVTNLKMFQIAGANINPHAFYADYIYNNYLLTQDIDYANKITRSGVDIIGSRKTGWSAPTGATSKATFDPSTVTTEELAQRVAALINDLTVHGLIGA